MWSKQADTRNKNMTSFKNKITNRKRKNGKTGLKEPEIETTETPISKPADQTPKVETSNKSNRNRRNRTKCDNSVEGGAIKTTADEKKVSSDSRTKCEQDDITKNNFIEKDLETADVVLRNANNLADKRSTNTNTLKRYSDSYVFEQNSGAIFENAVPADEVIPKLTRAVSGFLYLESRKNRFSDLFKSGAMKLSASTENLKNCVKNEAKCNKKTTGDIQNDACKTQTKQNNKSNCGNKNNKTKKTEVTSSTNVSRNNSQRMANVKKEKEKPVIPTNTDSYLKRVKSKIYQKTKSDDTNKIVIESKCKKLKPKKSMEISGRIPEDEEAVMSPPGVRKSLTHFDFRLMRQTSNLERRRSKDDKEESNSSVPPSPKPLHFFGKAKSSSAINLNLLRNRKNKNVDNNCTDVQSEFDFIAFGGVNGLLARQRLFGSQTHITTSTNNNKTPSWLYCCESKNPKPSQDAVDAAGDSNKTGQPVSRSGSDRRPDAVREERHQLEGAAGPGDPMNDSLIAGKEDWVVMPDSGEKVLPKKKSTNVNRSESVKEQSEKRKQRRNISDPLHNTTGGEIDLDTPTHPGHSNPDSNSSSTSSLSNGRLSESPSTSVDAVQTGHNKTDADSDTGFESDIPMWHNLISEKDRKGLNPQEQKRQEIINEIFSTEHSHVRSLRVLHKIFYEKLRSSQILKTEELHMIFPNIKELHDVHYEYNKKMKECREETKPLVKEVGDLLLRMFDGADGERLKTSAAKFCEKQHHVLEFITEKRKKDTKFDNLLTDCEKKRHCRRLPLQGILPTEMQRLSKYPMLLERLINNTDSSCVDELSNLKKAHQLSKSVANFVDEAVKLASNRHRLEEIQKHLEVSSLKIDHPLLKDVSLAAMQDLTRHKLIREGSMSLRRPNKPLVPVHVLLMEDVVYILQRDADRYVLKFYQSGSSSNMLPLSPYLKTSQLLVRLNAVCKNGLYLVNTNTNSSQIYDLITEEDAQRDMWFRHFSEAVETYNKKGRQAEAAARRRSGRWRRERAGPSAGRRPRRKGGKGGRRTGRRRRERRGRTGRHQKRRSWRFGRKG
ncbi:unnamed protein product [Brassicogethes aeneus]|uniref:DH domain-containing protein n=1 Tax=Brassicogethes aeneus TaxID=1431903 RepID=A0A9P0FB71_BRAAE|nr:unnamed protein product [Brassicogethes aeneus]